MTTKNKMEEWDTYNIPSYAVCLICYGDVSGLDDEDINAFNEWNERITKNIEESYQNTPISIHFDVGDDVGFCINPAFGLPATCNEFKIYVKIKQ